MRERMHISKLVDLNQAIYTDLRTGDLHTCKITSVCNRSNKRAQYSHQHKIVHVFYVQAIEKRIVVGMLVSFGTFNPFFVCALHVARGHRYVFGEETCEEYADTQRRMQNSLLLSYFEKETAAEYS